MNMSALRGSCTRMPDLCQRTIFTFERVGPWQWRFRYCAASPLHIEMRLAARIGAYHFQPIVTSHPSMTDAGGKDEHIAGLKSYQAAFFSPQPQRHGAFRYSQYLVRVGMEVCVIENRVRPNTDPSALLESTPKRLSFPGPESSEAASKDDHRKVTVRDIVSFFEIELLGRSHFARCAQGFLSALCFLIPAFRNLIAFLGPAVPVTRNFFPLCLL